MTTVTKKYLKQSAQYGGVPSGNKQVLPFQLVTNSSGVMTDSDQTTALVQTNKVRLGILPAGMTVQDCLAIVSDLFTASATAKIGFEYVDGVDDTNVAQDDDYFFAALALSAIGRTRANNLAVYPVKLPKDAYVIVTIAGADLNAVGRMDLLIEGST